MRSEKIFVWLVAGVFFSSSLNAQSLSPKYLSFDQLTINNGLSQGMVNTMIQDHFGFMWFGTKDGLNRYDGYHFVVYRHHPSDPNSVGDNFIQQVFEDSKGRLWIGTSDHGVDYFDREKETFTHFRHGESENTLSDDRIECITEDRNGAIWISTQNGLNKVSIAETASAEHLVSSVQITRYFSGYTRVFAANDGTIWGSSIGNISFHLLPGKNNHDRVDTLDIKKYFSYPIEDRGYEKFIGAMVEDTLRNVLYLLSEYSITAVDKKTGDVKIISTQRNHWGQFGRSACLDDNQVIWISERDWLEQFDIRREKWYRIFPEDHNLNMIFDNTSITFRDQSGVIWIGTKGYGLLKYNPRSEKFHRTDSESIGCMNATNDNRVIVTKAGKLINIFDPASASYTLSINDSSWFHKVIPSTDVGITTSAIQDKNGLFWLSKNCLSSFDEKNRTYKQYRETDHFNFPVYVDHGNQIWTGTDKVLSCFDPVTEKFTDYNYPVTPLRVPYDFLQCIYQDAAGIFWLGTVKGLLRFDSQTQSWKQFKNNPSDVSSLSFDVIFSICPDPKQPEKYLWIGTNGGGLNRFDIETGKVTRISQADGLPNNVVYGILSDNEGNLWMSTNKGVSRFNPGAKTFRNFEEKDGLQGNEFNRYAYCKTNDGMLFFGGLNGFNYFHPEDLTDNRFIPSVEITDFKLRNQSVIPDDNKSPLKKPVFLTDKIELAYSDNMISFEFASMDFTSPEKNLYRYRLEGFDKDWIQSANNHAATYTNLDPGRYTFTVLGSNNDGVWNEKGKSIQLIILPPWYMTWWFRIGLGLLIAALLYLFYRYRLRQAMKIQNVRNRIAQDLHDEIGSNLSNISIFSTVGSSNLEDKEEINSLFKLIKDYTQTSMEAMSDIVWMINAKNDRFENIIVRMRTLAAELFEAKNCNLHMNFDDRLYEMNLGMEERKNFYLLYKEAINNVAKYAACSNVWIEMKMNHSSVLLTVKDDGKGFDMNAQNHGNGLVNMNKRAEVLKGALKIVSSPGKGTVLDLQFGI